METSTAAAPPTPSASTLVYETTVKVNAQDPPGVLAARSSGEAQPLDAHHKMLHEGSILSSHLRTYQDAVRKYIDSTKKFFNAADEFLISAGQPSKYENKLTEQGAKAAAAASAALTGASAAAGSTLASPPTTPKSTQTAAAPPAEPTAPTTTAESTTASSAFAAEAAQPVLPLASGAVGGVYLCPGVPGTPALAAVGLTTVAPADICLPAQHEALFRYDMQRSLVSAGRDELPRALSTQLLPALQLWLAVYEECKHLLPQTERLRVAADSARSKLEDSKEKVVEAEAAQPLVSQQQLLQEGQMPKVLVQGAAGGGLVAAPAAAERQAMYDAEKDYTDATLAFELTEKVLRDKLTWLMRTGGGLKASAAAAMAHALRAAAAQGEPGEAAGGSATGKLRAPREELLEPFPQHVLSRLAGEHLPTLPQVVLADLHRLARWGARYRKAMQAAAAASAAAAGAQMLAAAAAPAGAVTSMEDAPAAATAAVGGVGTEGFARTDDQRPGEVTAGTAAGIGSGTLGRPGSTTGTGTGITRDESSTAAVTETATEERRVDASAMSLEGGGDANVDKAASDIARSHPESAAAAAEGPAAPSEPLVGPVSGRDILMQTQLAGELKQAAKASDLPLDLLAAAVAADVEERDAAAANKGRADVAWRLMHEASVVAAKQEAVLVPAVSKYVGAAAGNVLLSQHKSLADSLSRLGHESPSSAGFDLLVLEVLEILDDHVTELSDQILPALAASTDVTQVELQDMAKQYRQAAAAAPTRPHGWFLGTPEPTTAAAGVAEEGGLAGGAAATRDTLKKFVAAPVKAGVALVDAAADLARFGPGKVPEKF